MAKRVREPASEHVYAEWSGTNQGRFFSAILDAFCGRNKITKAFQRVCFVLVERMSWRFREYLTSMKDPQELRFGAIITEALAIAEFRERIYRKNNPDDTTEEDPEPTRILEQLKEGIKEFKLNEVVEKNKLTEKRGRVRGFTEDDARHDQPFLASIISNLEYIPNDEIGAVVIALEKNTTDIAIEKRLNIIALLRTLFPMEKMQDPIAKWIKDTAFVKAIGDIVEDPFILQNTWRRLGCLLLYPANINEPEVDDWIDEVIPTLSLTMRIILLAESTSFDDNQIALSLDIELPNNDLQKIRNALKTAQRIDLWPYPPLYSTKYELMREDEHDGGLIFSEPGSGYEHLVLMATAEFQSSHTLFLVSTALVESTYNALLYATKLYPTKGVSIHKTSGAGSKKVADDVFLDSRAVLVCDYATALGEIKKDVKKGKFGRVFVYRIDEALDNVTFAKALKTFFSPKREVVRWGIIPTHDSINVEAQQQLKSVLCLKDASSVVVMIAHSQSATNRLPLTRATIATRLSQRNDEVYLVTVELIKAELLESSDVTIENLQKRIVELHRDILIPTIYEREPSPPKTFRPSDWLTYFQNKLFSILGEGDSIPVEAPPIKAPSTPIMYKELSERLLLVYSTLAKAYTEEARTKRYKIAVVCSYADVLAELHAYAKEQAKNYQAQASELSQSRSNAIASALLVDSNPDDPLTYFANISKSLENDDQFFIFLEYKTVHHIDALRLCRHIVFVDQPIIHELQLAASEWIWRYQPPSPNVRIDPERVETHFVHPNTYEGKKLRLPNTDLMTPADSLQTHQKFLRDCLY